MASPLVSPRPLRREGSSGSNASSERASRRASAQPSGERPSMPQRHSSTISSEALINSLEAEEERLVLSLSKKLEQVRNDNVQLQTSLEKEQEALFHKLAQLKTQENPSPLVPSSPSTQPNFSHLIATADPLQPSESTVNQALQAENTFLRESLTTMMRDRDRSTQTVEVYRSELIELRQRLGLDVGDLIGTSDGGDSARRRSSQLGVRPAVPVVPTSFSSMHLAHGRRSSGQGFAVGSPPTFSSFGHASTPLSSVSPSNMSLSLTYNTTAQTTPGMPNQTLADAADHLRAETADGTLTPARHLFVGSPAAYIKAPPPSTMTSGANSLSSSLGQTYGVDPDMDDLDQPLGRSRSVRSRSTSESWGSNAKVGETGQFRRARGASGASADRAAAQRALSAHRETVKSAALEESAVE